MTGRRNTELGLMLMTVVIVCAAYVLASLGSESRIPANIIPFLVAVIALFMGAHFAVRKLAPGADPILLPTVTLLNGLGYVVIAGLNEKLAAAQATWTAIGIVAFVLTLWWVKRPRDLERYRYTFAVDGLGLLLLPLVPGLG